MERNYDEVIADMLIQLDQIETRRIEQDARMKKFDQRMDLTIKRMVKAETRLEASEKRMELFNKKLEQSIRDQQEFSRMQSKLNEHFLKILSKLNGKKDG